MVNYRVRNAFYLIFPLDAVFCIFANFAGKKGDFCAKFELRGLEAVLDIIVGSRDRGVRRRVPTLHAKHGNLTNVGGRATAQKCNPTEC